MPAQPPKLGKLNRDDFPEAPEYFARFVDLLSPFIGDTRAGLTETLAKRKQVEKFTLTTGTNVYDAFFDTANKPKILVKNKLGYEPTEVRLARCVPAFKLSGTSWVAANPNYQIDKWQTPSLLNSWVNYGSGYTDAQYMLDHQGFVHVRGLIKSGTTSTFTVLFALPAGYRPAYEHIFVTKMNGGPCEIRVQPGGDVFLGDTGGSATWTSLDGMYFQAAGFVSIGPFGPPIWEPTSLGGNPGVRVNYIAGLSPNTKYEVTLVLE